MNTHQQYELAWVRLQHVLSFFDRVDTKLSVVLGVNVALFGVLTTQLEALETMSITCLAAVALYGISSALSFFYLYRGSFPQLQGGEGSLIYFAQIANRTSAAFATEVRAQEPELLLKDVLEQVHTNAVIATKKYRYLCLAYRLMAISLVPWGIALAILAMQS